MRKLSFIALVFPLALYHLYGATNPVPITSFGSNPYFSTELYPQDLLLRPGSYLYYSPTYRNQPYWGDVDEPGRKPNTNTDYTITAISIKEDDGTFNHSGTVHSIANNLGYAYRFDDNLMGSLEFDYKVDMRNNTMGGDMTGDSLYTEAAGGRLPFYYESNHTLNRLDVRAAFGRLFGNVPFGLQLNGGFENSLDFSHKIRFEKLAKIDSLRYESDNYKRFDFSGDRARLLWGATTVGCSHPFAIRGTQGDMWKQDEYAVGPVYHINLLGATTLSKVKGGLSFRYAWGHQNQYEWRTDYSRFTHSDSLDMAMSENFIGSYVKDNYARITRAGEGAVFGNIRWREGERFALKTFARLSYGDSTTGRAPWKNLRAADISKEKFRSLSLDVYPNVSVKLGEFLNYVDGAILFRYRFSRYDNLNRPGVYNQSTCYGGWEEYWESSSYANENSVDMGADFAAMFPLFSAGPHHLSLNLRLFGDVRFTLQKKYYGRNNRDLQFSVDNIRKNTAREVMFNTFLMLHYIRGPYHLRLHFTEPVLYSIAPATTVTDAKRNIVNDGNDYPLKKSALWITKDGIGVALYASYDMVLPFLPQR